MASSAGLSRSGSSQFGAGLAFAVGAYGVWGLFPLYFAALMPANPLEVVVYRVVFSLAFCLILIAVTRGWRRVANVFREPRVLFGLALAGCLIFLNWEVFILAVNANLVVETSLGYFFSPLVSVALGVFFFRERLRRVQWIAVSLGLVAVVILAFGLSISTLAIPLVLGASFGFYGMVKKRLGGRVNAIDGFAFETAWVLPVAIVQFFIVGQSTGLDIFRLGTGHAVLMVLSGVVTAIPLLLFAAGARRLPLSVIGMIQFFTPVSSFLLGIYFFHEAMQPLQWAGFILVWIALVSLTADMLWVARKGRSRRGGTRGNRLEEISEPLPE
jgi:chloramphenicol-sensitive protein RarD